MEAEKAKEENSLTETTSSLRGFNKRTVNEEIEDGIAWKEEKEREEERIGKTGIRLETRSPITSRSERGDRNAFCN